MKHEFARLIWVLDIARALADLSDDDLNEVFKLAKTLGVEGGFLTSCELARYSFDTVLPSRVVTAIERQPVISAQAHAPWERIVTRPANPQSRIELDCVAASPYFLAMLDSIRLEPNPPDV